VGFGGVGRWVFLGCTVGGFGGGVGGRLFFLLFFVVVAIRGCFGVQWILGCLWVVCLRGWVGFVVCFGWVFGGLLWGEEAEILPFLRLGHRCHFGESRVS